MIYQGHPLYEKERICIADLKNEPLISLNNKYQCYTHLIRQCHDHHFEPNIIVKTIDSSLIYRLCAERTGIGIDVNIHPIDKLYPNLKYVPIEDTLA